MEKVTLRHGTQANLPTSGLIEEGCLYYCTDTGNIYYGASTTNLILLSRNDFYGTCDTAAATQTKVVNLVNAVGFKLTTGVVVRVKFTNNNTYSATASEPCKLNVNGTGAVAIVAAGTAVQTGTTTTYYGRANYVNSYVYNGSQWVWQGSSIDNNTTYTNVSLGQGYGTCDTAAATAAKVVTMSSYEKTTGGIVVVAFTYNVPASATLNINGKGATAIHYNGSAITANVIQAGDRAVFMYTGSTYTLLTTSRLAKQAITGLSISGKTITYTKADGSTGTLTTQDTTYESKAAASGGTDVSLVTTGEKYTWNSKAAGNHTHTLSLASGGTSTVNLAANTAYTLTAGGSTLVFKTPADGNTDTKVKQSGTTTANWRKILTGYQNDATAGTAVTEVTETVFVNAGFEFQASTGTVRATNFTGKHSGYTLAAACAKGVDTSITAGSTSTNLPTTAAVETRLGSFLAKSGGTMTGALTLSGAPTADLHAATKKYVDDSITALPEPMVFKGSLGTGGTIATLPTASASNEGFTYKVITAGTYASQTAKVGDTFISDGSAWVLIPSGDEPSGTVTSVKITATSPIVIDSDAAITTSGTRALSHANSGATAGSYGDSSAQTPAYGATFKVPYVTVNATGHVTAISEHTVKIPASDNTNTHRPIQVNGTQILGDNTTALNLKAGTNVSITNSSGTVTIAATDTTYSAGTGLSLSGTTINHSNSVTAGTAGTSSATSGSTLSVPYVTYDAQGHVTASGTHTHTVDGFLPSSGGTITGDLTRKDTRIDASKADNNVTTTLYPTTFNVTDVSNRIITRKEAIVQSNGNISAFWYCSNYDTSGTMVAQKGIKITVNKAGTATYEVSDGANFRSAIGAGTVTSIATSGTGISGGTITSSGTITLDSSAEGNRAANKVVIAKAAGQINSEKWATTSSGTVKVTTQYNSTDASLDFIFA